MKAKTVGELGERKLIALIRAAFPARGKNVILGIGDDAAVVRPGRTPLILTKDLLVEDVDFYRDRHPAFFIGRKSLSVNLSDIAAMGGTPRAALLGLGLPGNLSLGWIRAFLKGFAAAGRDYGVDLIGGDVSKSLEIVVSVTVSGEGEPFVARSGARPGDGIYVSGTLGDAALGFALIEAGVAPGGRGPKAALVKAFLDPAPRIALGRELARRRLASAMIDISDGLSVDLRHLGEESGAGAEIELAAIPLSAGLRAWGGAGILDYALNGGEDFQLLFTVRPSPRNTAALAALARRIPLTRIGRIIEGKGIFTVDAAGRRAPLPARGYEHFKT
jgi:thiamine-monophosphate kinase